MAYICGHPIEGRDKWDDDAECSRRVKVGGTFCYLHDGRPKKVKLPTITPEMLVDAAAKGYKEGVRKAAKAVLGIYQEHMNGNVIASNLASRGQMLVVASRLALDLIGEAPKEQVPDNASLEFERERHG